MSFQGYSKTQGADKTENRRQYTLGALISYVGITIDAAIGLFYTPFMVRQLGQSHYALYALAYSFVSLILLDTGLSAVTTRFVSKYRAEHDQEAVNSYLGVIARLFLIIDALILIVLVVMYFFIETIYQGLTPQEIDTFKVLYCTVVLYIVVSFPFVQLNGVLSAYELFIQLNLCVKLQRICSVVLIIAVLLMGGGVTAAMSVYLFTGIVAITVKLAIVRKRTPARISFKRIDRVRLTDVLDFSVWSTIISMTQRCVYNIAPSILGAVSTSVAIALFAPANLLESYFYLMASAVGGMFLPKVSQYIADNREDKLLDLMLLVGRYQMVFMGMVLVNFVGAGKEMVRLWMGEGYDSSWVCAVIMYIPDLLLVTQVVATSALFAKGLVRQQTYGYLVSVMVCVLVSFVLSRSLGEVGVSIGISAGYFALFLYLNVMFSRHLELDMTHFYTRCYVKFLIPLAVAGAVGFAVSSIELTCGMWLSYIVKSSVVGTVYTVLVWLLAFTSSERSQILSRAWGIAKNMRGRLLSKSREG